MSDAATLEKLGRIEGLLEGITKLMNEQSLNVNRRIDDLRETVTQRMDSQQVQISKIDNTASDALTLGRTNSQAIDDLVRKARREGGMSGAGASALIAGGIELAKAFLKH